MKSALRLLCLVLPGLLWAGLSPAALIHGYEFYQKTFFFDEEVGPGQPSTYGQMVVMYSKDPNLEYLNVSAMVPGLSLEPVWLVQNFPLYDLEMGPPEAEVAVPINLSELGVEYGVMVADIQYGTLVTAAPLTEEDGEIWAYNAERPEVAPVHDRTHDAKGAKHDPLDDPTWSDPPDGWRPTFAPGAPEIQTWSTIGCDMDNVDLDGPADDSGCVPAATANSMSWLKKKHPEINFPESLRKSYEQLSHLMNRKAGEGVTAETLARAKLDFIEAHNLPIKVKFQTDENKGNISSSSGHTHAEDQNPGPLGSYPTKDWIFNETQEKEDVELLGGYYYKKPDGTWAFWSGHAIVLAGAGEIKGAPYIDFKDDAKQSIAGGLEHVRCWIRTAPNGAIELVGQGATFPHSTGGTPIEHRFFIYGAVSESHDPGATTAPPNEHTFGGYCEKFTRVIPPGKTLEMDFPESTWWCRNVTAYTVDRSEEPAKDVKHREWNNNDGKTRKITNSDPTKTLTVTIHCDDRQPYRLGYAPWTVTMRTVDNPSKETTPGNPDDYGGFSMGWRDSSSAEFGDIMQPMLSVPTEEGTDLKQMPRVLGTSQGVQELTLTRQIPVWNQYWEELGFIIDAAEVTAPGQLEVECPYTGTLELIDIPGPGRYEILLGAMPPSPDFWIRLRPQGGLEMQLDAVGVPSMFDPVSGTPEETELPATPVIRSVYPNPFNPMARIAFALPEAGEVELEVYDMAGRRVATVFQGRLEAGEQVKVWNGRDARGQVAAAGTYLVRLRAGGLTVKAKATLVK